MIVNKNKVVLFLFEICIGCKLLASLMDTSVSRMAYLLFQISAIILISISIMSFVLKKHTKISNKTLFFFAQAFIFLILYSTVFINSSLLDKTYEHIKTMFLYYAIVMSIVSSIRTKDEFVRMIECTYYCIGFITVVCFIVYFDNFGFLTSIGSLFSTEDRYRWAFGFYHENFVGNLSIGIILLSVIFSVYKRQLSRNNKLRFRVKLLIAIIDAIAFIMLLSSASRSNLIALIIFGLTYVFLNIENILHLKNQVQFVFTKFFIVALGCVSLLYAKDDVTLDTLFKLTNRSLDFVINIPALLKSGRVLIGLGYVDAGIYGINGLGINTFFVDNSFLYMLLSTGVIGIIWMILVLINLFFNLLKDRAETQRTRSIWICLFCAYIIQGCFETCIFYPTFVTSYVYLALFITYIKFTDFQVNDYPR